MHSALGARGTSPTAAHAGCSGLYATPAGWHGNRPPPALGEHTDVVLAGLGLDAAAIETLRQQGVIQVLS